MLSIGTNPASAAGLQAGVDLDLPNHFFVGGDAFANYFNGKEINYNYGFKGNLGYKILGVSAYGLAGVQHSELAAGQGHYFKDNTSPLYGVGIGYNFPLMPLSVKLENSYFYLNKKDGDRAYFNSLALIVGLVF